jgi:hypothetical protein
MNNEVEQLKENTVTFLLDCKQLAEEIEAASSESWRALSRYRKCRSLLNRCLGTATGSQTKAMRRARKLAAFDERWLLLRKQYEHLSYQSKDDPALKQIQIDLAGAKKIIQGWGSLAEPNSTELKAGGG